MNGVALVLAGGGGKGAYHIGVWKALREYGVDRNVAAVAGTSVGALNAALFMQGDYPLAEKIWLSLSHDKLLTPNPNRMVSVLVSLGLSRFFSMSQLLGFATAFSQHGVFSREGMIQIINESLDLEYIGNSNILGIATCCKLPLLSPSYFRLNGCPSDRLQSILLASSALPLIYGAEEIDGSKYVDGGLRDNVPIKPLYDKGYRQILVVHLNRETAIERSGFPDANIIEILPQNHQGDFINGTLDFSPEGAARRIQEGYADTVKILKPIYETGVVQHKIQSALHSMKAHELQFSTSRQHLLDERASLKAASQDLLANWGRKNDARNPTRND